MNIRLLLFFILCLLLSLNGISQITGQLIDGATKKPIPFGLVHLPDFSQGVACDAEGKFILDQEFPNTIKIACHAHDYKDTLFKISTIQTKHLIIPLKQEHTELGELIVSCHAPTLQNSNAVGVESKSYDNLNAIEQSNLGEALNGISGVYNNSMGNGISKPVIRGLSGVRVVTYANELRIENQQWGADHGMGLTGLGVGNIEVIKGPSSLLYGSDALGGVLYLRDEDYISAGKREWKASSSFSTGSLQSTNKIGFKWAKKKMRLNLFGGFNSAANYRMGDGKFVQNSGVQNSSFKGSFGYTNKNWILNARFNVLSNKLGIPGHSHLANPSAEDFKSTNQRRTIFTPFQRQNDLYFSVNNKFFLGKNVLNLTLGKTIGKVVEHDKVTVPEINLSLDNNLYNLAYRMQLKKKVNLTLGMQGAFQKNSNGTNAIEVIIPDFDLQDNGALVLLNVDDKKWGMQTGIRYDNRSINTRLIDQFLPFKASYSSVNYALGGYAHLGKVDLRFNLSTGFRAPHVSELLSDGSHNANLRYEKGNLNLKSEQSTQFDLGIEVKGDHANLVINPFYNMMSNYIFLNPQDSIIDGFQLYTYQQTPNAHLYGIDAGIHFHPHFAHHLHLETTFSYLKANDGQGNPFPLIPQTRINSILSYDFDNRFVSKLVLNHQHYFAQKDVASFETVSQQYDLFGLGVIGSFSKSIGFKTGITNVFDIQYISHISSIKRIGLLNQGRNFYLSLSYTLKK